MCGGGGGGRVDGCVWGVCVLKLDIRDGHDAFSFTIVLLLGVVMLESSNSSVNNDLSFILRTKMTLIY